MFWEVQIPSLSSTGIYYHRNFVINCVLNIAAFLWKWGGNQPIWKWIIFFIIINTTVMTADLYNAIITFKEGYNFIIWYWYRIYSP